MRRDRRSAVDQASPDVRALVARASVREIARRLGVSRWTALKMKASVSTKRETAVLMASDIHYGKKTATFGPEDVQDRMARVVERACAVRSEMGSRDLVVLLLGDINDGTDIYATQPLHQAVTNVEEQAWEVAGILASSIVDMAKAFDTVRVVCVAGNHGRGARLNRPVHEAANWDIVAYRYMSLLVGERASNVVVDLPDTSSALSPFIRAVDVCGHTILAHHGHWIRGWAGIPYYGLQRRVLSWSASARWQSFAALACGHFHTCGMVSLTNERSLYLTGTLVTDDDYAMSLGLEPVNRWWIIGVCEERFPTWIWSIDVGRTT